MTVVMALVLLTLGNMGVWLMVSFAGGQLLPVALQGVYAHTSLLQRAVVCGALYVPVVMAVVTPFAYQPVACSFAQSVLNAGYVVLMAVVIGGKVFNLQIGLAAGLVAAASVYLSYALMVASQRVMM